MHPDESEQFKTLQHEMRILAKNLQLSEKARKRLEDLQEQNQLVLEKLNTELAKTLEELQTTQLQLIQSEKLAGLGQLIAGISHEINTPAAAIIGAVEEINKDYDTLFETLLQIAVQLPKDLHHDFVNACHEVLKQREFRGTNEERTAAKDIEQFLVEKGVPCSHLFCSCLAKIGYDRSNIETLIPLLSSPQGNIIHNFLFMLGMNKVHLVDVEISIQRVASLVRALKLYSRADQTEVDTANITEDIKNVLAILHHRLRQGITIIEEYEPLPKVRCYANQLNQVWTNLLNNSIEALKSKGTIIIRTRALENEKFQVEVEDHGPGIPKEILSRIFEPYFTTKRKGEGTGLGLALTKQIVEKHRGKIEVESQPGKTIFRVILPLDVMKTL